MTWSCREVLSTQKRFLNGRTTPRNLRGLTGCIARMDYGPLLPFCCIMSCQENLLQRLFFFPPGSCSRHQPGPSWFRRGTNRPPTSPVHLHISLHNEAPQLSYAQYSNGHEPPAHFNEPKRNYSGTGFTDTLWIIAARHRRHIHSRQPFSIKRHCASYSR